MKKLSVVLFILLNIAGYGQNSMKSNVSGQDSTKTGKYEGIYCSGTGDVDFLQLIDESFAFFHPNPVVPNLTMVYKPEWNTFSEGAAWDAWWIQNSYGFSYAATPFLQEPWKTILQNSWDLFWDNQGDGIRKGLWGDGKPNQLSELIAPDGSLGDAAAPKKIIYKQGDGNVKMHDWFYEATAAGIVMQSEILLAGHDLKAIARYLPKMERACDFIEKARDPKNNLFLVGPACNLLAPSYGGVKQSDGTFGKGYLTGLSITYLAAIDRMVEIYKLKGDLIKLAEYQQRQKITRESLPQLLTTEGYFVKSMEADGTKHGVLGQKQYGYLEGVANADAVALRVVDDSISAKIYNKISAYPGIRPYDFLLTNAPGLDDTYGNWGSPEGPGIKGFWKYGDWVNGGVWGTVEGRAILMYYRLGKFGDIRRSAIRAMKWAKDFRMDAPWSQWGSNTSNPWSDKGEHKVGGVAVMIDNFAIPAATIRGLFDCDYRSDRLILRPRIPGSITSYTQKEPILFGQKKIFLSCRNGGPNIKSVSLNGKLLTVKKIGELKLIYNNLPAVSKITMTTDGGWPDEPNTLEYPSLPSILTKVKDRASYINILPEELYKQLNILTAFNLKLARVPGAAEEKKLLETTIKTFEACQLREMADPGPGYYRPITPERIVGINKFYEQAANSMYLGYLYKMTAYSQNGNPMQKRLANLFFEE